MVGEALFSNTRLAILPPSAARPEYLNRTTNFWDPQRHPLPAAHTRVSGELVTRLFLCLHRYLRKRRQRRRTFGAWTFRCRHRLRCFTHAEGC